MFMDGRRRGQLISNAVPTILSDNGMKQDTKDKTTTKRKRVQRRVTKKPKQFNTEPPMQSPLVCHALRIMPDEDLKSTLRSYATEHDLQGAFILSCVGSLKESEIRTADSVTVVELSRPHEILSLSGTVSGGGHLHICLSDEEGKVIGGHLLGKSTVLTTAEVVLGELPKLSFTREMDSATGYKELVVGERRGTTDSEEQPEATTKKARRGKATKSNVKLVSNENGIPVVSVNDTLLSITHA